MYFYQYQHKCDKNFTEESKNKHLGLMEGLLNDKQEIENKLYNFFTEKMNTEEAPEIEDVKRFKGYLATNDNGIVIDCADGTQIVLTIQTR